MKKCKFKFDSYILGFVCLVIVCILPAISPVVYLVNNKNGVMPYLLILVAIAGILYEYPPDKEAEKIIKVEQVAVYIWSFLFLIVDLVIFVIRADTETYTYICIDYCLMGYVIVPLIVTIIEIIRSTKEYFNSNSNNNDNNNLIAVGNALNV